MGRHLRSQHHGHHGAVRHGPRPRLRSDEGVHTHRRPRPVICERHRVICRRAYVVCQRNWAYRVWRIDGRGTTSTTGGSAQARVLLDNLQGYPDNLMRGRDGRSGSDWSDLAIQQRTRSRSGRFSQDRPAASAVAPAAREAYGHVFAIDEEGRVTISLQDPAGAYPETTGATETADRLYIQSLDAHAIGWLPRGDAHVGLRGPENSK